jgi:hypothetical protein
MEPEAGSSRRTGDMTDTHRPPNAAHVRHDLVLLAATSDDTAAPSLRAAAAAQIAGCSDCELIADDLRAISSALGALPRAVPAPRDMRLSPAQAAAARRRGWWARILEPFGSAGIPGLQALGGGLATIGLAGILFVTLMPSLGGSSAAAPVGRNQDTTSAAASVASGAGANPAAAPSSAPSSARGSTQYGAATATPQLNSSAGPEFAASAPKVASPADSSGGPSAGVPAEPPYLPISVALLGAGLLLLALRFVATRV